MVTHIHFYKLKEYNVDTIVDASDNVISGNESTSEMLTSRSKKQECAKTCNTKR